MRRPQSGPGRLENLSKMLRSRFFIAVLVISAVSYYALFYYLVLGNEHVFIINTPMYLVYALAVSSAAVLAASLYTARLIKALAKTAASGGTFSVISATTGGIIIGCGCSMPILGSILYAFGMNSISVWGAIAFVNSYQAYLLGIIILINAMLFYYYSGKGAAACRTR